MTPIELRQASTRATAILQAMRDAAAASEGRPVDAYDGPHADEYGRIYDEWLADLTAPELQPVLTGIGWGMHAAR